MRVVGRKLTLGLAIGALLGSSILLAGAPCALASDPSSAAKIFEALKPAEAPQAPLTRSMFGAPKAPASALSASEKRLLDTARTRAITIEERKELVAVVETKKAIDLEVNFEYNSAAIGPAAAHVLASLGAALSKPEMKGSVILVAGHTDARGSDAYNMDLSGRRAHAVRAFLIGTYKLSPEAIVAVGHGEEQLKLPHDPYAGANRRVQVVNMSAPK
jgi:outer membrane protein OmpA-like peptidoglycan-associated protein